MKAVDFDGKVYDLEDEFKNIPDLVGIEDVRFGFRLTHWFLSGFNKGFYNDTTLVLDDDCFGDYYVTKANELEYLSTASPFGEAWLNVFPGTSMVFQFYYMMTGKCNIDTNLNDFAVYCWYKGCWPDQMGYRLEDTWLYILRSMNEAAIVWYEGVPDNHDDEESVKTWINLTEESGIAAAQIFIDVFGFRLLKKEERF